MIRLSVRLPEKLHAAAKGEDVPIAETIRRSLEAYLGVYRDTSKTPLPVGGLVFRLSPPVIREIARMAKAGRITEAIERVRSELDCGLWSAKLLVDYIKQESSKP